MSTLEKQLKTPKKKSPKAVRKDGPNGSPKGPISLRPSAAHRKKLETLSQRMGMSSYALGTQLLELGIDERYEQTELKRLVKEETKRFAHIENLHLSLAFSFLKIVLQMRRELKHPGSPLTPEQLEQEAKRIMSAQAGHKRNRSSS